METILRPLGDAWSIVNSATVRHVKRLSPPPPSPLPCRRVKCSGTLGSSVDGLASGKPADVVVGTPY